MDRSLAENVAPHTKETCLVCGEESREEKIIAQYVKKNRSSTNTQLFSFLALLKVYLPKSYLLMSECQQILGPPDPIHGGPPFEDRMKPFTHFIDTSSPNREVSIGCPMFAERSVEILANLGITRSITAKNLMILLCGDQPEPHIIQFIKDLLAKREIGEKGKEKFSRLIEDIQEKENIFHAISVLKTASQKFEQNATFPQTIARLYYIRKGTRSYERAEEWAKTAIQRAPKNSYVADTLGQVYKNHLREAKRLEEILHRADKAFKAFKNVEEKAEKEEGPEMKDTAGAISISNSFNNRGLFGFMQVAKITYEKPSMLHKHKRFFRNLTKMEVEAKFDFFEWYLNYSKPGVTVLEPSYFWKDVVLCYEHYTPKKAAESTSFPGLLDRLNRGLFISKGSRAGFEEDAETVSDLEATRDDLKTTYEANVDDIEAAKRYILSNIILSNKMPNSPHLTPVRELQILLHRFMDREVGRRSPEYYLLVLLLFWPEEHHQEVQEEDDEEEEQATEDDESEGKTWEDEDNDGDQETGGEATQLPLDLILGLDLQKHVTFMENAFERDMYAKYLRGRYLLPLFFLGKGCGLCKWVHKSKLDAIVEETVDADLDDSDPSERIKEKWRRINKMWSSGDVWQVPEIQDILLPVKVEPCQSPTVPSDNNKQEVFVCAGEKKIKATTVVQPDAPAGGTMLFYLGFTIQGPVIFEMGIPHY